MKLTINSKSKKKLTKPAKDSFYYTKKDITEIMLVAEKFADHVNQIEARLIERTQRLGIYLGRLQKEVNLLKKGKK